MLSTLSSSGDINKGIVPKCLRRGLLSSNYWRTRGGDRYLVYARRQSSGQGDVFAWRRETLILPVKALEAGWVDGEVLPGSCQSEEISLQESVRRWEAETGQRCPLHFRGEETERHRWQRRGVSTVHRNQGKSMFL